MVVEEDGGISASFVFVFYPRKHSLKHVSKTLWRGGAEGGGGGTLKPVSACRGRGNAVEGGRTWKY